MAKVEKHDFSERVLDMSERFQQAIGHSTVGSAIVKAVAGSQSPAYRQLDWQSRNITTDVKDTVTVPGDPNAGRLPRNWHKAMIMATDIEEIPKLKGAAGAEPSEEAIAYITDNIVHVGTKATDGYLFEKLTHEQMAIAMRLGKAPLEATMGLWLPNDRAFIGVENVRVAVPALHVSALVPEYPGIILA